jgi:hypothetical protein
MFLMCIYYYAVMLRLQQQKFSYLIILQILLYKFYKSITKK